MGLFDKIDTSKIKEATKSVTSSLKEASDKSKELKQPVEGAIKRYGVTYLGGLSHLPSKKSGEIGFNILHDCFYFKPTSTSVEWFQEMAIPYNSITNFEITTRTLSTSELLLTSDARGLETDNNIEITYTNYENISILLRIEMLTGITVAGQAVKCKEMMDLLRSEGILNKFNIQGNAPVQQQDVLGQITKLNELMQMGIISIDEFNWKKQELLTKL